MALTNFGCRLDFKGRVLGHKRAKRKSRVATKEDAQFYLGTVRFGGFMLQYVYKAKREIQGSRV
ncbi:hypothetical protein BDZ89DRAFT_1186135 [Hymenopellis radicata]|nr:hypothetical protein BDZ89DRAFT_1186135 [Hymenopellis radicata]